MLNYREEICARPNRAGLRFLSDIAYGSSSAIPADALKESPGLITITFNLTCHREFGENGYASLIEVTRRDVDGLDEIRDRVKEGIDRIRKGIEGKWEGPDLKFVKLHTGTSKN